MQKIMWGFMLMSVPLTGWSWQNSGMNVVTLFAEEHTLESTSALGVYLVTYWKSRDGLLLHRCFEKLNTSTRGVNVEGSRCQSMVRKED